MVADCVSDGGGGRRQACLSPFRMLLSLRPIERLSKKLGLGDGDRVSDGESPSMGDLA